MQSCIHCHQVGDAMRQIYRDKKEPIPEQILFPYPHPKSLGLILDPRERATVLSVEPGSPAAEAGFEKGDSIEAIQGQPLLSIADVQWVLHQAPPEGVSLKAEVLRNKRRREVVLSLPGGWRQRDGIAWRATSWDLRRMATGGLLLKSLTPDERKEGGFADNQMALRVEHVGQYGAHAVAKEAGFREGDIITSFDGQTGLTRETDLMAYALSTRRPGDKIPVTLVREGQVVSLVLAMQ